MDLKPYLRGEMIETVKIVTTLPPFPYQYDPASLKSYTREQRGVGVRRKVSPTGKLPKDWNTFLRNDTNKTELFSLLADRIYQNENGIVYATKNSSSISNKMLCSCA